MNDIKTHLENDDISKLLGSIKYIISEVKNESDLTDIRKNKIEDIKYKAFQWREKLSLEISDCLKKIKNIQHKDTFGTENMYKEIASIIKDDMSRLKYKYELLMELHILLTMLDNFINPQETYPVIATTSKLMTTGVDAQTCKLIVLDSNIGSMTEFKQIIGRGTRINEEYGKTFFTIMDFRGATDKFADPDFDGESVMIKDIFDGDEILNPEEEKIDSIIDENGEEIIFEPFNIPDAGEIEDIEKKKREKVYINGVDVTILNERVQIRNSEGKLITTSYKEYSKQKVHEEFSSLDDFLNRWSSSEKKQVIIDELYEKDILFSKYNMPRPVIYFMRGLPDRRVTGRTDNRQLLEK